MLREYITANAENKFDQLIDYVNKIENQVLNLKKMVQQQIDMYFRR